MTPDQRRDLTARTLWNLRQEGHGPLAAWAEDLVLDLHAAHWTDTHLPLWLADLRCLADRAKRHPHAPRLWRQAGERLGGGLTAPLAGIIPTGTPL